MLLLTAASRLPLTEIQNDPSASLVPLESVKANCLTQSDQNDNCSSMCFPRRNWHVLPCTLLWKHALYSDASSCLAGFTISRIDDTPVAAAGAAAETKGQEAAADSKQKRQQQRQQVGI